MTTRTAQAQRLVKAISSSQRSIIAMNPRSGIETLGYTVVAEPALTSRRGAGGMCDGLSFAEHNVVMFAPTPGSKRENFTLLHEVAHILVERDDDTLVWLADRENPAVEIERLCEQIAAMLLVPEGLVEEVVGSGPITADDLRTLIGRAQASGPACAIALTPYLGGEGAVVIIDRATQQVVHSSLRGELAIYPWRGVDVPSEHPLHNLQQKRGSPPSPIGPTPEASGRSTTSARPPRRSGYMPSCAPRTCGASTCFTGGKFRLNAQPYPKSRSDANAASEERQEAGHAMCVAAGTARAAGSATAHVEIEHRHCVVSASAPHHPPISLMESAAGVGSARRDP